MATEATSGTQVVDDAAAAAAAAGGDGGQTPEQKAAAYAAAAAAAGGTSKDDKDDLTKLDADALRERLAKEIEDRKAANREAQTLRSRATTAEKALKEKTDAELSELERAQKKATELETENARLAAESRNARILAKASTMGFADPADAVALLDRSQLKDDESNLGDLLEALKKAKPHLVTDGKSKLPGKGSGGNPGNQLEAQAEEEKRKSMGGLFPTIGRRLGTKT